MKDMFYVHRVTPKPRLSGFNDIKTVLDIKQTKIK